MFQMMPLKTFVKYGFCCFLCNVQEKQLGKTISERSILAVRIANFRPLREPCQFSDQFLFFCGTIYHLIKLLLTAQCYICHSPFSTIMTVSPILVVRADVVISVLMAGYLSSCGVELFSVFDTVVGLISAIFPGSLQSKLLFEQSVEKVEELFQFIGTAA